MNLDKTEDLDETINFVEDLADVELGDERRNQRCLALGRAFLPQRGQSLPNTFATSGEVEACYRFVNNPNVDADAVLAPCVEATRRRVRKAGVAYVVHDTTEFQFSGEERAGLERLVRTRAARTDPNGHRRKQDPQRESLRWCRVLVTIETLKGEAKLIHVMEREGDFYELFAELDRHQAHFIARVNHDRYLAGETVGPRLSQALAQQPVLFRYELEMPARPPKARPRDRQQHPARTGRRVVLEVRVLQTNIPRPWATAATEPEMLALNYVWACEVGAPAAEKPVTWLLATREPVDTPEAVRAVLQGYQTRWVIEEFFKALKTGCRYELTQLETGAALFVLLSVLVPVACQMLWLRTAARTVPERPAEDILGPELLVVLLALCPKTPPHPSAQQALAAIASLGGHFKSNGPPGWLVLIRGLAYLHTVARGFRLAQSQLPLVACP